MLIRWLVLGSRTAIVALCAVACGGDCVALPCPLTFAITVGIRTAASTDAIPGSFIRVGSDSVSCAAMGSLCAIAGQPGNYAIDIGAPGYQIVHRTVAVTGQDGGCNTCGTVATQHLDIVLTPVS